jgi:hypothetical protein
MAFVQWRTDTEALLPQPPPTVSVPDRGSPRPS